MKAIDFLGLATFFIYVFLFMVELNPHDKIMTVLAWTLLMAGLGVVLYMMFSVYLHFVLMITGGRFAFPLRLSACLLVLVFVPAVQGAAASSGAAIRIAGLAVLLFVALAGRGQTERVAALRPDNANSRAEMAKLMSRQPPERLSDMVGFHLVIVALLAMPWFVRWFWTFLI